MYRLGRGRKKSRKRFVWLAILLLFIAGLLGAGIFLLQVIQNSEEEFTPPKPIVHEYAPPDDGLQTIEQTGFSMKLPKDWTLMERSTERYNFYKFRSSEAEGGQRHLYVYVDSFPQDQAFNRILPVYVDSNRIIVSGPMSDNCTSFTGPQGQGRPPTDPPVLPAKWQGASFLCDMANYVRNVIGVAVVDKQAPGVELVGATGGRRTYFFVYVDATINPEHKILDDALASFQVK